MPISVESLLWISWELEVNAAPEESRKNDYEVQGHEGVLVICWMNTWMVDGVRGSVLWKSSSPLDWSSGASWSRNEDIFIVQMEENHNGFKISYLVKEEREDLLNHLFEMLLLLKIGLDFFFLQVVTLM